jgi:hypothetical protein
MQRLIVSLYCKHPFNVYFSLMCTHMLGAGTIQLPNWQFFGPPLGFWLPWVKVDQRSSQLQFLQGSSKCVELSTDTWRRLCTYNSGSWRHCFWKHLAHNVLSLQISANSKWHKIITGSWALVAYACNPSFSGSRDQEDHSSKPATTK